ncbi:MAG: DNA translocase FtsK, partial [Akkermansia sp.]|nr:DNA translocase FtsK [Akkermansia sp.]
ENLEEKRDNITPTPAPVRVPQPAPTVRPRTPRPADSTPKHMSAGDNLLDLMTEVEDEIERRASGDYPGGNMPTPRSSMPLSPAAEEAFRRFRGIKDDKPDTPAPALQPEHIQKEEPIDKPQARTIDTPQPAPRPVVQPAPVTPRPQTNPRPPRELPTEDTRAMYEDYPLPPYDMLFYKPQDEEDTAAAREEMFATQQNIIETLSSFRIDVEAGDITRGPSITRYEFYPPKGLKLNRITNLADNLKLATQSKSINILAPIPGKNTVGIELENDIKAPVYLRELLQSEAFHSPKLRIPVALGKDVYGNPVIGDLAAMPHTLVAGTTGSGKSVCVNSMILSMLYKFRPDELRLILVDPKVVEMQPYKKLPHLACPVVTNAARVIGALRWAVNEMEHRYKLFSKIGVRNFEDFNNRPEDFEPEPEEEEVAPQYNSLPDGFDAADAIVRDIEDSQGNEYLPEEEEQGEFDFDADEQIPAKLPYIVIIIDELADLMMQVKEDLENYIARLTQKARAAGIHLVAATQTPRANVITGIIKANIPSRLAFKVASPLDSRVILDTNGAENLLGKGDFLFLPPGGVTKMTRAQGAFV